MNFKFLCFVAILLAMLVSFTVGRSVHETVLRIPELTGTDGQVLKPGKLKGSVSIVSYFQSWCSDCVKEQPELQKLSERFGDSIRILMVSDEPMEKIKEFRERFQSKLNFYHCREKLKTELGVKAFPTTYLLDKKGRVVITKVEGIHWYTPEIIAAVSGLLRN